MGFQKWLRILLPELQLVDYVQAKGFRGKKQRMGAQAQTMTHSGALRTESVGGNPQHVPHSAGAVGEVVKDARYGIKQMGLNRSNDELDTIFAEIKKELNGRILRQGAFIDELLVSYKKAFFKREKGKVQNAILLAGPAGTGKFTTLQLLIDQLYKKKLVPYKKVATIDLRNYTEKDIHSNFVLDCSAAFEYGVGTVCFLGIEQADAEVLQYVSRLVQHGFFRTSNSVMVDASNYFLVFYSDVDLKEEVHGQLPSEVASKIPAPILKGIQSYAISAPLMPEDVEAILRGKFQAAARRLESQTQLTVKFEDGLFAGLVERILATKKYGEAIESLAEKDFYQALVDLRARGTFLAGDLITIQLQQDDLLAVKGEQSFLLKSIPMVAEEKIEDLLEELNRLTGLHTVKRAIHELLETVKAEKMRQEAGYKTAGKMAIHMVFTGNPGTGKTTVARLVSRILKAMGLLSQGQLVEAARQDLVGEYLGSTAPKTNAAIERAIGGVLFIDEAYALSRNKQDPFGMEAIDTLVKGMEDHRDNLVMVLAGYTNEMDGFLKMNPGLQSRFPYIIEFPDYSSEEMYEILTGMAKAKDFMVDPGIKEQLLELFDSKQISGRNDAGNGRLVRNMLEDAIRKQAVRLNKETGARDYKLLTAEDFGIAERPKFELEPAFEKVVGLENVKDFIRSLEKQILANEKRKKAGILTEQSQTLNIVFSGNPGTGKTTMARMLAEMLKSMGLLKRGHLIEVDRSNLVAEYMGQTAVKTTEVVQSALGGVLFIDEAYSLVEEGVQGGGFGKEAIDTLVRLIENHRNDLVVVLAGYTDEMEQFLRSNPGLGSRFPLKIEFPDYTQEQLTQITDIQAKSKGFILDVGVKQGLAEFYGKKQIPGKNDSGNGRLVRNTLEAAIRNQAVRIVETDNVGPDQLNRLTLADFGLLEDQPKENALQELASVVGLDEVKTFVRSLSAQIEVANKRKAMGLPDMGAQSLHMVFKGNPGTGKTTIARILARRLKELGVIKLDHIVETDRSGLVAGYVGQTALKTREVLEKALGGILFVDEAYALFGDGQDFGQEAIDTIVKFMDDHRENIIVILAGYEDDMEQLLDSNAGLRSRFPNVINFPDYAVDELVEISRRLLKPKGYELSPDGTRALKGIFESVEGNTSAGNGRLARNICEAAIRAHALRLSEIDEPTLEDLTLLMQEDFLQAGGVAR
ncbi:AAA family ATPase [Mesobacillus sp. AQ2]|uniref:AAA family ATPase n=1 Tax=Mesobacillus sp. AQ2 TaxID=3043332 RepID=UPI0024C1D247|nr:AAA family ATPase [Mesobacillus sp. AQ2]WHX41256.1 AAA family ATPase [Mesobacillus sp. AQ2]